MGEHEEQIKQEGLSEPEVVAEGEMAPSEAGDVPRVDLNTATEEELCQLPGIGPVLAARIVNYRVEVHPFEEPVEITAVPGISETTYRRIADRLTVGEVEAEAEPGLEAPSGEEVPVLEMEPEPAAAAERPPAREPEAMRVEEIPTPRPIPLPPQHRGVGWGGLLLAGLASAIAGAVLALLALLLINGTLDFRTSTVKALQVEAARLGEEISRLDADMGQLQQRLEALQDLPQRVDETQAGVRQLNVSLSEARAEMESMARAMEALRQEYTNLREDLDGMAGLVSMQGRRLDEAEQRLDQVGRALEEVSGAVRRFDAFLEGLRHLLNESMGPPTPSAWKTPTPRPRVTVIPMASPTAAP